MENVQNAIAWYQTKIGSYDKQLWEQSVEKKLQKQPPFVLDNAPRKKVRLKTEYIDVDLIRGSTFTKTKPQAPWVYITRKAVARVLFFPFYYNWWVHQTSKRLYTLLLVLYLLQVVSVFVYLRNFDHSIMEDEVSFTEVTLPAILMFLLCLIHSQTVLAHINHKPPKCNKNISGVTRKPRPKKTSRKGRSSGNNSTCQEDGGNTDTSRSSKRRTPNHHASDVNLESQSMSTVSDVTSQKNADPPVLPTIDMEKNLMSRSVSDYELKPATNSIHSGIQQSSSSVQRRHKGSSRSGTHLTSDTKTTTRRQTDCLESSEDKPTMFIVHDKWEEGKCGSEFDQKSECTYSLLNNLPNLLTVEKVYCGANVKDEAVISGGIEREEYNKHTNTARLRHSQEKSVSCTQLVSDDTRGSLPMKRADGRDISKNLDADTEKDLHFSPAYPDTHHKTSAPFYKVVAKSPVLPRAQTNEDVDLGMDFCCSEPPNGREDVSESIQNVSEHFFHSAQNQFVLYDTVTFECPSTSDNLSMSDFEMVDHVTHKRNSLDLDGTPAEFAAGSPRQTFAEGTSLRNMREAKTDLDRHQISNLRVRSRQFKSQDSTDSGINNEVPACVDCTCPTSHRDIETSVTHDCARDRKWQTDSTSGVEDPDDVSVISCHVGRSTDSRREAELQCVSCVKSHLNAHDKVRQNSSPSLSESSEVATVKASLHLQKTTELSVSQAHTDRCHQSELLDAEGGLQSLPHISVSPPILKQGVSLVHKKRNSQPSLPQKFVPLTESSSQLQCFSELFVQEILNEDTLREMSCSSLLVHSDLENSSSSVSRLSTASSASSASNASCSKTYDSENIPLSMTSSSKILESSHHHHHHHHHHRHHQNQASASSREEFEEQVKINASLDDERDDALDESLEQINISDGERPSDDVSNYNPSDSDADSDGPVNEDLRNKYEEKWKKRLRFQELAVKSEGTEKTGPAKVSMSTSSGTVVAKAGTGTALNGSGSRSVVGILTRKPSPLKDLAIGRKAGSSVAVTNSSGSDQGMSETHNQLRRRRRTSGTPTEQVESNRQRNIPTTLGLHQSDGKSTHISSSENETGGARTPEGSNKATMSSEEWEDRMQSDESTSSAYSSNSEVDSEEKAEEEEKTEYTTSTLHVINLLQPGLQPSCAPQSPKQSGSPSSSGTLTQPDRVSCMIWEGNECKKVDLTALDIGWAIIDKVDGLPESSDYFLIGLIFSVIICVVPLVFRAYASKESPSLEELLSWSGLIAKLVEMPVLISNSYSWRQYLLMVNGILQRFFLSLMFFFLLSVADRTFKQRMLYAKHFSYLTSSRRARKFSMPHFRLNKVRNIKIWLSLRSYLKRRGPQRSVDVIVSACFLCAVCTVCLISLQMLKDTNSYLDYLCNWELLVWCTALGVFLMRFMTVGLKINKKYRNLSVLITEQINLYLQMEQKPHKKEELILANNVLRLAEDLLKELESPFKISGFSANPLIYNIMRVVVLSAFSAVLTEVLGFKLKLHKIKLKG